MPFTPFMLHLLAFIIFVFCVLFMFLPPVEKIVHNPAQPQPAQPSNEKEGKDERKD